MTRFMLWISLLALFSVMPGPSRGWDSSDFVTLNNRSYYFEAKDQMDWYQADLACTEKNTSLLTLKRKSQLVALGKHIERDYDHLKGFWTGAKNFKSSNKYHWKENDKLVGHAIWAENYPTIQEEDSWEERCVGFGEYEEDTYQVVDEKCTAIRPFICQAD